MKAIDVLNLSGSKVEEYTLFKYIYQTHVKQLLKQRRETKLAAVVESHGDKKELEELDKDLHVHHNGEVEELYLALQVKKTIKLNKTKKNID